MPECKIDDPDLTLKQVLETWPETASVFMANGMLCVGCLANPFHTIADAVSEYHLDDDEFRSALLGAINKRGDLT